MKSNMFINQMKSIKLLNNLETILCIIVRFRDIFYNYAV